MRYQVIGITVWGSEKALSSPTHDLKQAHLDFLWLSSKEMRNADSVYQRFELRKVK
jgi:hypothetical protein